MHACLLLALLGQHHTNVVAMVKQIDVSLVLRDYDHKRKLARSSYNHGRATFVWVSPAGTKAIKNVIHDILWS